MNGDTGGNASVNDGGGDNGDPRRDHVRFSAYAYSIAQAFVELDAEQTIVHADEGMEGLTGRDGGDLVGRSFLDLIPADDHSLLLAAGEMAERQGRCGPIYLHLCQQNGDELRVEVRGTHLPDYGGRLFLSLEPDGGEDCAGTPAETTAFRRKIFEANQVIFDEGDSADTAYILRSGKVDIRIGTRGDNPGILTTIKVGDVFGELALMEDRAHRAAAIAMEQSEVLIIPRDEFIRRLVASDPVMKTVVSHLARRLRETTHSLEDVRRARWVS
ncbi:MAG: cyclic nucleotide-binding domain-containing protein [Alphaproteobacteria bacterium]|jgi:PAS domain S-box-containing protein|nr:cyclic nucleotide-binding domain-containing protein [Alphaproteobacteria bacterium]MDP6875536.1 cyclic nucleotide-binding domain-containing protein [Alphaproteobacteria bacterium]